MTQSTTQSESWINDCFNRIDFYDPKTGELFITDYCFYETPEEETILLNYYGLARKLWADGIPTDCKFKDETFEVVHKPPRQQGPLKIRGSVGAKVMIQCPVRAVK